MKERPIIFSAPMVRALLDSTKTQTRRVVKCHVEDYDGALITWASCPYGQPGDRLWVRETFTDLLGTGIEHRPIPSGPLQRYVYAADIKPGSNSDEARKEFGIKWKPSIFMPRAASRITLELTAVRAERLQDISDADALAEGVDRTNTSISGYAKERYRRLWESINGPDSWAQNPWVWVIEFKRVQP